MKKIAMIVPSLKNVGPVRVAYDIVTELFNSNCNNHVYFEVFYCDSVGDVEFPCKATKLTLYNFYRLYGFDIIHSHMIRPDLINSLLFLFRGKRISTIHNIVETDLYYSHGKIISSIFSKIWRLIWKRLDYKIVLTEVAREYYVNKMSLSSGTIFVVNNGVEGIDRPEFFDKEIQAAVSNFKHKKYRVLGSVALFNDRKGLEQVIKLLAKETMLAYVIIGDGPILNKLKSKAEELGVSDRVYFSGFKDNGKENVFLFDCYVMPSREEGFPLALTEAISTGVVTVCSDIAVFREILDVNSTAFFELDNIDSLSEAVNYALNNADFLSYSAKTKYECRYTRKRMAENYMEIYKSL